MSLIRPCWSFVALILLALPELVFPALAGDGNRLAYLDESCNPYYVGLDTAKLATPQWIGEDGVEAVIVLSIDDLRDAEKYESFLRPIFQRLAKIDGRTPVSLMTNSVDPNDPQLQKWLSEGASLETHTFDHPCPLLQGGDLAVAKRTFDRSVDLVASIANNRPVAYRMPCCDSMSSVSPRFFTEIFNKTTPSGRFLSLDSSVFMVYTADDPELPRELVLDKDGREKFRKYVPTDRIMANLIEDYPYPYVVDRLCREIPTLMPSDWDAQHLQGVCNSKTVADLKAAVDATVIKQGIFALCFHPHGWIRNDQIVEVIDHAVSKHGKKVKFLTFREVEERLTKNLLGGNPLRAKDGKDNGVRVLDIDNDSFMDVVVGNGEIRQTRLWLPKPGKWTTTAFPLDFVRRYSGGKRRFTDARFGVWRNDGNATAIEPVVPGGEVWHFNGRTWDQDPQGLEGLPAYAAVGITAFNRWRTEPTTRPPDPCPCARDVDNDGCCELILTSGIWSLEDRRWQKLPWSLPLNVTFVGGQQSSTYGQGRHAGLRLVDIDEDGRLDVVCSNAAQYSVHLFTSVEKGWSRNVLSGKRGDKDPKDELPMIVRPDGTNNGAWFKHRHMWVQNEDTGGKLPGHVASRWFTEMLAAENDPPLRTPEQSLQAMQPRPGFKVELMAAEPLVMDPIDIAWGPDGKAWVVEMADYPMGMSPAGHRGVPDKIGIPGGRVRFLEDTDGDGQYDKSTVFLEPVGFPSGVMPWRKGVIVTAAPEVFYAEDTDGDGRADLRRTLFSGFGEGNQQHRANHPRWGLDNWVYLANGDSNGRIKSSRTGKVVDISGRDLRIRPDSGEIDAQSGRSQYGRNRDDWGNWFGCNNPNPGWHFALTDHYIRRNPHVAAPPATIDLMATRDSYPIGRVITHCFYPQPTPPEGESGTWTCICGVMIYRDELLGPDFSGNLFVSDSVYNVVHRMIVEPQGATFRGRRAPDEQKSEFLASSDPWFRPTSIRTGPDGALWVCDMYRAVIEHPEWIDERLIDKLDLRKGHDRGRIYRIYPVHQRPRSLSRLHRLDTVALTAALDGPNGWQRDMAQQMLIWRADEAAIGPLRSMATDGPRALARLHALCTLDGLQALDEDTLQKALHDEQPGVRRHAVRLCGQRGDCPGGAAGVKRFRELLDDPDPQVRMQLAYSLGDMQISGKAEMLGRLAGRAADDPYLMAAVLSSATGHLDRIVAQVLPDAGQVRSRVELVEKLLRLAVAVEDGRTIAAVFQAVAARPQTGFESWQYELVGQILDGLARQRTSLAKLAGGDDQLKRAVGQLGQLFDAARELVANEEAPLPDRVAAMRILGRGPDRRQEDLQLLAGLLMPQSPLELQVAVVETMGRLYHAEIPQLLLQDWEEHGPKLRGAILDELLKRENWTAQLFDAVQDRVDVATGLGRTRRDALLRHPSEAIRHRAEQLLGGTIAKEEIQKSLEKFEPVLKMTGDLLRGKEMFTEATCADCHKLQDVGKHVGPDLRTLVDKSPRALLVAIVDPNRALEDRFIEYIVVTTDGLQLSGMLQEETGNSITLADVKGESHVILRRDVEELVSSNLSHMPEGLEGKLDLQQMADLIAFVAQTGPPCKEFPGNRPEIVTAADGGSLQLPASAAAIYGPTLEFEPQYGNLGQWYSAEDRGVWTIDIERGGPYDVWLDWACQSGEAGKRFLLEVGGRSIRGSVPSTGQWSRYSRQSFGQLELDPGEHRLVFRSDGPISGALIDLRCVTLAPVPAPTPALRKPSGP